jgi:hypothetical protein
MMSNEASNWLAITGKGSSVPKFYQIIISTTRKQILVFSAAYSINVKSIRVANWCLLKRILNMSSVILSNYFLLFHIINEHLAKFKGTPDLIFSTFIECERIDNFILEENALRFCRLFLLSILAY